MPSGKRIVVSEADPQRRRQIAAALAEMGDVRGVAGSLQDVKSALRGGGVDAIVLGGPAESLLPRVEAIRGDRVKNKAIVVFCAGMKAGDPLAGPVILKYGASFVAVVEEAFKGSELDSRVARGLKTRLTVLLRSTQPNVGGSATAPAGGSTKAAPARAIAKPRQAAFGPILSKPTARAASTSGLAGAAAQDLAPKEFEYVRDLVRAQAAIVLEAGKEYLVQVRLEPLARQRGLESVSDLIAELMKSKGGPLREAVVEALTTNETTFFRDGSPFKLMREKLIPELVSRGSQSKKIRVWCAASSTGQEPYSIAMSLHEAIPNAGSWDIKIRASDISEEVLTKARSGVYNQLEVSRGLPAPMMVKHFTKNGLAWEVKDHIKRMVAFEKINLIQNWPNFEPLDFLFIRNVLIYFDVNTKQAILAKARALLKPTGVLFLGSAETTLGLVDGFDKQDLKGGGAFRRCA